MDRLELAAADLQNHVVDLALCCAYLFSLGFAALIDVWFCCASLLCDNFLWSKRLHLLNRSLGFRNRHGADGGFVPVIEVVLNFDLWFAGGWAIVGHFRVDQRERHLGHAGWLAIPRADKDHIFHARAAQALGRLFAQHPGDGVGNIRLAAPIGPHNGGNAFAMEFQFSAVAKRLKSKDLQLLQSEHASSFVEWLGNTCNVPS